MAQSDFFFNVLADYLVTPSAGQPVIHESLSNPLTEEGVYCRYWETTTAAHDTETKGVFAKSLDTNFEAKIQNKPRKYSVRALIRIPAAADFSRTAAGIRIKTDNTRIVGQGNNAYTGGYKFFLHNGALYTGMTTDLVSELMYVASDPLGVDVAQDSWYRIRMDITPIRLGGNVVTDKIEYYTGTGKTGQEKWTKVGVREFTSTNLIGWGSTTYKNNGFFLIDTHSSSTTEAAAAAYFDSFQVLVSGR